jgi:hypothetical protein
MESRVITCSCTGVLCRITLYVLFRRYITAVLFSAYSRMGSVLPCVIRCEITAVITAYTLLTTLDKEYALQSSDKEYALQTSDKEYVLQTLDKEYTLQRRN